jgi:hypothetical protein
MGGWRMRTVFTTLVAAFSLIVFSISVRAQVITYSCNGGSIFRADTKSQTLIDILPDGTPVSQPNVQIGNDYIYYGGGNYILARIDRRTGEVEQREKDGSWSDWGSCQPQK